MVVSETRRGRCFEKKPYTLVFTKIFYLCSDVKDFVSTYLTLYGRRTRLQFSAEALKSNTEV